MIVYHLCVFMCVCVCVCVGAAFPFTAAIFFASDSIPQDSRHAENTADRLNNLSLIIYCTCIISTNCKIIYIRKRKQ